MHIALIEQVFGHTADVVAGHSALASIAVEGAHFCIGNAGFFHEDNAVAADAVMRCAQIHAQGFGAGDGAVKVFKENIVIAAGLHLGKGDPHLPGAHVIDVDKLRVPEGEAAFNNLGQCAGRIRTGQTGNAQLHGTAVQERVISDRGVFDCAGIDDIAELSALHEIHEHRAFRGIGHGSDGNAER